MIKLSPKALRFAVEATSAAVERHPFGDEREAIWLEWSEKRGMHVTDRLPPSRYIEVPDQVGVIFLRVIEQVISSIEGENSEIKPDLGNDLAFLHSVETTLKAELGYRAEPNRHGT